MGEVWVLVHQSAGRNMPNMVCHGELKISSKTAKTAGPKMPKHSQLSMHIYALHFKNVQKALDS